jgi:hypothetical protein
MRAGTLFCDLPAEQSFRQDEIIRPKRPERERAESRLPPPFSARRMEGAAIEPVRIAKKNGLLLTFSASRMIPYAFNSSPPLQ